MTSRLAAAALVLAVSAAAVVAQDRADARRDRGEVDLAPPTWVTLHDLAEHADVESVLSAAQRRVPLPRYETRWGIVEGGAVAGICLMNDADARILLRHFV